MKKEAVLWDMDGVLVDDGEWHYRAWYETLSEMGIPFDWQRFQQTFGMNNAGILSFLLGYEPKPDVVEEVGNRKEERFRALIRGKVRLALFALRWLERLQSEGLLQAVASSAPQANLDALLDELKVRGFFQAVVSGAQMPGKPDPAVFLEAARRLGVLPGSCVVVEDSVAGLVAAHRAGMKCLAVATTHSPAALREAEVVVKSLGDLRLEDFLD